MLEPNPAGVNVSGREIPEIPKIPSFRWLEDCHGQHFSMRCFETKSPRKPKNVVSSQFEKGEVFQVATSAGGSRTLATRLQGGRGGESLTLWKGRGSDDAPILRQKWTQGGQRSHCGAWSKVVIDLPGCSFPAICSYFLVH